MVSYQPIAFTQSLIIKLWILSSNVFAVLGQTFSSSLSSVGHWPPDLCTISALLLQAAQLRSTQLSHFPLDHRRTGSVSRPEGDHVLWDSYLRTEFLMCSFGSAVVTVYITGVLTFRFKTPLYAGVHTLSGLVLINWGEEQFHTDELCFILIGGYIST